MNINTHGDQFDQQGHETTFFPEEEAISVSLSDMLFSLSTALDLIDINLYDHHNRVCYISVQLAKALRFSTEEINDIYMAAIMHDIGAIAFSDRMKLLNFEAKDAHHHAQLGYELLSKFSPFSSFAPLVRFHHVKWENGKGRRAFGEKVPYASHVIHLADRIAVLLDRRKPVFGQVKSISERIIKHSGRFFVPAFVDAFLDISKREAFWLDLKNSQMDRVIQKFSPLPKTSLTMENLTELARFFSLIIDTRSRFTATHSSGVAFCAAKLGSLMDMSAQDCSKLKIAGYLHDLGKLAVPDTILTKPDKLNDKEWQSMRAHPYNTQIILEKVRGLEDITYWASHHHEDLNGKGYPFGITAEELTLGARVVAAADIFTALTEDRPYRKGMEKEKIQSAFSKLSSQGKLDCQVVECLLDNFEEMNWIRKSAQEEEKDGLSEFWMAMNKSADPESQLTVQ
ncbi:MAG: HD domain-containing protein [Nitrospina sp.]|nr:HD domain-containing protein [Nitrospina sp.]MBT6716266.1 HD domain-containing protein [Nitrospina sp.]